MILLINRVAMLYREIKAVIMLVESPKVFIPDAYLCIIQHIGTLFNWMNSLKNYDINCSYTEIEDFLSIVRDELMNEVKDILV